MDKKRSSLATGVSRGALDSMEQISRSRPQDNATWGKSPSPPCGSDIQEMQSFEIPVGNSFKPYVEAALTRVGYLFSEIQIEYDKNKAVITIYISDGTNTEQISKEVKYALYRERIYQETLPIRKKILGIQQ